MFTTSQNQLDFKTVAGPLVPTPRMYIFAAVEPLLSAMSALGTRCNISCEFVMACSANCSPEKAESATGTACAEVERFVAVTKISSTLSESGRCARCSGGDVVAGGCCAKAET